MKWVALIFILNCFYACTNNLDEKSEMANPSEELLKISETKDSLELRKELLTTIEEEARPVYVEAFKTIKLLHYNVALADSGLIKKNDVLREFNTSVGSVFGFSKDFHSMKLRLDTAGEAYIDYMYAKAQAEVATRMAAEKSFEAKQLESH